MEAHTSAVAAVSCSDKPIAIGHGNFLLKPNPDSKDPQA